jgi:dephospho-CoA kinase
VRQQVAAQKQKLRDQGVKLAIYDVPLLFEKNMQSDFDKIIVVSCRPDLQKSRLIQRNSLTQDQVQQRISAQLPMDQKIKQADIVIENDGTLEELKARVQQVIAQLGKSDMSSK